MHGFGATPEIGLSTLSQCQAACLSDLSCFAIDYDPNNIERKYCWLMTNDLSPVIGPARGVTHYILDRNCTGTS